jgi:hypothetical protein
VVLGKSLIRLLNFFLYIGYHRIEGYKGMTRYSIALGKKKPRIKVSKLKQKKKFPSGLRDTLCGTCEHLNSRYVGDGFDEFYEWKCRAAKSRLIGHDEPFNHCETPSWCPKMKNICTYKDHTRAGHTHSFRCKKCGRLFNYYGFVRED